MLQEHQGKGRKKELGLTINGQIITSIQVRNIRALVKTFMC